MSTRTSLAPLLESFFRHRLTKQRNASRATFASYRDALRMLILFAAERTGQKPHALAVEDLDRDLVLAFLDELEQKRKNTVPTRNARQRPKGADRAGLGRSGQSVEGVDEPTKNSPQ